MNRRIVFSILALLGVCIIATGIILGVVFFAAGSSSSPINPTPQEVNPTKANQLPQRLDTPMPAQSSGGQQPVPAGTTRPTPVPPPPALAAQMDEIQQQVIALRGLQPNKPVVRGLISPSDLQKKVETDFFKDYTDEEARDDTLTLSTLGLLPRNFDLRNFYLKLYGEQVAGFYDNETKEMFVVEGPKFGGVERMTYAHEFTHTLQDQTYDLKKGLKIDDAYCKIETEYCSAVTALLEGDASLIQSRWLFGPASNQDRNDIQSFSTEYSSPIYDSAPQYMQKDFLFPYMRGLEFVNSLVDRGGYGMIDKAFKDPPVSAEQILHPDKYPSEKPINITLPDIAYILGGGWQVVHQNVLGEWFTFLVLSNGENEQYRLPENLARSAAAGWGGDKYAIFTRKQDGAVVLVLQSRWDTEQDASEFFSTIRQYAGLRWGDPTREDDTHSSWNKSPDGEILLQQQGTDTLWLLTPDILIQQSIIEALPIFQPPA
ncbi:MAG: hypothetical protein WCG34_08475 [Leptolinea sp.]